MHRSYQHNLFISVCSFTQIMIQCNTYMLLYNNIICIIHAHIVYYNNRCVIRYIHSSYIGMNVCDSIYDNGVWSMACVL